MVQFQSLNPHFPSLAFPPSNQAHLRQLPRHIRQPPTQPTIHRPRLRINIARLLTRQKQHCARNLIRLPASPQRIQLPNLLLTPPFPRRIIRNLRHARLNQPGTNRITPDPRAHELVRTRLHERDDGCFTRTVVCGTGIRTQARDRCSRDDGAARIRFRSASYEHSARCVFRSEENRKRVCFEHLHEVVGGFFPEDGARGDAGVGEEDVEAAVCVESVLHDGFDGGFFRGVEGAGVDGDVGVEGCELARVQVKVRRGEVAEVDCFGAVAGELVG
jgi:hypothetical protein